MSSPLQAEGHLGPEQVAAYLDRQLSVTERTGVEAHLADCLMCRTEVVEVARIRRARPLWRRWAFIAPAAAAAATLIILVGRQPGTAPGGAERGAASEGIPRFAAVQPSPTEPVATGNVAFVWRSAGGEAHYRLTLTDPSGRVLWSTETADTVVSLAAGIRLAPGQPYFWYVGALLPSGESATTGIRRFSTRP